MQHYDFDGELQKRISQALEHDNQFNFKRSNGKLIKGECPSCNKKELFVNPARPWKVKCNRANNCGYEESTQAIYPEILEGLKDELSNDPKNPNGRADGYMRYMRGFPIEKMADWFTQGHYSVNNTTDEVNTPTVRFLVDAERHVFWERFIEKPIKGKRRHHWAGSRRKLATNHPDFEDLNGTLQKGLWWTPPGQVIEDHDQVYLVEGIFHAIALHFSGVKAAATFAAGYFPSESIKPYLGKNITWVWGLDFDKTGLENMAKHSETLENMGENTTLAITGREYDDWDDLYKKGVLTKDSGRFFDGCLYRGLLEAAKTPDRKAFVFFREKGLRFFTIEFKSALYSVKIDTRKSDLNLDELKELNPDSLFDHKAVPGQFTSNATIEKISPCFPQYLYAERNQLTRELSFFVRVDFSNGAPRVQETLDKNALEGPKGFHKALVGIAAGGAFYGNDKDFRFIYDGWFHNKKASEEVKTLNYMGYDSEFGGYVFDKYGFKNGRYIEVNEIGLVQYQDKKTKTTLKDIEFVVPDQVAKLDWLAQAQTAFGMNGLLTIAYWFGTFYSEQLRKRLGWFPFFEMSGPPGTGKSTIIEFLWKASGRSGRYEGINPTKYTQAARGKAMTKFSGLPMVMVEGDTIEAKQAFDINEMKDAFNGGPIRGVGLPTGGSETIEPPFKCGFMVAQNAMVDCEKAMISRFVHTHWTESHFSNEGFELLKMFRDMSHEQASKFMFEALKNEKQIMASILGHYQVLLAEFRDQPKIKMVRIQEVHALITACFYALDILFGNEAVQLREQVKNMMMARAIDRQKRMTDDHPDIENFWSVYEIINIKTEKDLNYEYSQQTMDVEVLNHSKDQELVAINLNEVAARAEQLRHRLPPVKELKRLLNHSTKYKFMDVKPVSSQLTNKSKHCWVFEKPKKQQGG
jgi:hypothetical protein